MNRSAVAASIHEGHDKMITLNEKATTRLVFKVGRQSVSAMRHRAIVEKCSPKMGKQER